MNDKPNVRMSIAFTMQEMCFTQAISHDSFHLDCTTGNCFFSIVEKSFRIGKIDFMATKKNKQKNRNYWKI